MRDAVRRLLQLIIISAVSLFFIFSAVAQAKSYHFSSVDIDVIINPDGSFNMTEDRTFDFSGDYHWAEYILPVRGANAIADFSVSESGKPFPPSPSGETGTMLLTQNAQVIDAKWFFQATDEKRTFTIKYRAVGGVQAYRDTAEFYWKLIGPDWGVPTDRVSAVIHLPAGAGADRIKAWGHGPLQGSVKIVDGQTVRYTVDNLPSNTFLEARIAFPTRLIPHARVD